MTLAEAPLPRVDGAGAPDDPGTVPPGAPVAIVGMAVQLPGAPDLATYWRNLRDGVDATSEVPADRWDERFFDPTSHRVDRFYCRRGGFLAEVQFDPVAYGIMPVAVDDAEPDQLLALQVAQAAADDAGGVGPDRVDPERVGVILGRGGYLTPGVARLDQRVRVANQLLDVLRQVVPDIDDEQLAAVDDAFQAQLGPVRPEALIGLVPNLAASRVANRLDLRGPAFTIDAACASSLLAVEQGVQLLRDGRGDVVLAGGVHHCHDLTFWSVFTQLGALSRAERIRPFDRAADGLLIGEGTAVVVLKRLADAERDGDRVYAVVRGVGSSSDGRASSLMKPRVSGQVLALRRAWADAGLDPATVGLVEAHGTATPAGDEAELSTLAEVFGPGGAGDGDRAVLGSVKSMIGHTMPTAGAAGLVKAALALHHRTLLPSLHCDDPHPGLAATRFRVLAEAESWATGDGPRRAAVNAFGFGGINGHVVLEEAPAASAGPVADQAGTRSPGRAHPSPPPGRRPTEDGPPRPDDVIRPAGQERGTPVEAGRARVAVRPPTLPRVLRLAADDAAGLAALLAAADDDLLAAADDPTATSTPAGVLRTHGAPDAGPGRAGPARVVLVDPTADRLRLARKVVDRGTPWRGRSDLWFTADPLLGSGGGRVAFCHPGVEPTFGHDTVDLTDHFGLSPVEAGELSMGRRVRAIVALGRTLARVLGELGIRPDLILGHSVGEWTGMNTAGHIPPGRADEFADSIDLDRLTVPDAWYVALGCSADAARDLVVDVDDALVTHDNCPHQSMACAPEAGIEEILRRAKEARVLAQRLPFRSGFHSPLIADHLGPFVANLDRLPLQEPHTPLWSATTGGPYPVDAPEVRALAARHLVEPIAFGPLLQQAHDEGVRAFVQVGAGSVIGFVDDALRGREVLAVSAGDVAHPGLQPLTRALAGLWAEGLEPDWERLVDGTRASARTLPARTAGEHPTPDAAPPGSDPSGADVGGAQPLGATTSDGPERTAERAGPLVTLRLGAPLLRLGEDAPILRPTSRPQPAPGASAAAPGTEPSPLARRLADVMGAVGDASREVVEALDRHPSRRHGTPRPASPTRRQAATRPVDPGRPAGGPSSPSGGGASSRPSSPPVDRGPTRTPPVGPGKGGTERTVAVSTDAMPWITDHCFYRQPEGWADERDRFPVVPMTAMVQLMADEVARVVPDRVVVALRSVRALRWLAAAPAREVVVRTGSVDGDEVTVAIDGHARAVAVLADAHRPAPEPTFAPLTAPTPPARRAAAMYGADRMMFHGPAYQGVDVLGPDGADGIDGTLVTPPAPGALLDSTGQLMGYWVMLHAEVDRLALPVSIDELAFFGPHPTEGTTVDAAVRITTLDPGRVRADHELVVDGAVWCRITGWEDRRFQTDEKLWPLFTRPEEHLVGDVQAGGWELVTERWPDAATRELVLRRYTTEAERAEHDALTPRAQRTWLLGRVAAKDAVRRRWMAQGASQVFPVEIGIVNDEAGAPLARPADDGRPAPRLSIAHVDGVAVALAGDPTDPTDPAGQPVGIDVVRIAEVTEHVADLALTDAEARLVPADGPERAATLARLWAVKEAAGKAAGTGLAGRPRSLAVEQVVGTRHRVGDTWVDTTTLDVGGMPHVVAWTTGGPP